MHKQVKISKGLDIKLKGSAHKTVDKAPRSKMYAVKPTEFYGIKPRLTVKVGNHVDAGDILFYHKYDERIKIASPVSGTIEDIVRGEKRKILKVLIKADATDTYKQFAVKKPNDLDRDAILNLLSESGLFVTFKQRPYDVIANPDDKPKAIFISAYDSAPLGVDYDFMLKTKQKDFLTGIESLKKLTEGNIYIIVNGNAVSDFEKIEGVTIIKAFGPHPVGNASVSIEQFEPSAKMTKFGLSIRSM
jgi:Na+-transporting NADH:ubiquinone oxidoreductase subunit A